MNAPAEGGILKGRDTQTQAGRLDKLEWRVWLTEREREREEEGRVEWGHTVIYKGHTLLVRD